MHLSVSGAGPVPRAPFAAPVFRRAVLRGVHKRLPGTSAPARRLASRSSPACPGSPPGGRHRRRIQGDGSGPAPPSRLPRSPPWPDLNPEPRPPRPASPSMGPPPQWGGPLGARDAGEGTSALAPPASVRPSGRPCRACVPWQHKQAFGVNVGCAAELGRLVVPSGSCGVLRYGRARRGERRRAGGPRRPGS